MYTQLQYRIPSTPVVFDGFQTVLATNCMNNAAAWNLPTDLVASIAAMKSAWDAAYGLTANRKTSSPAVTAARNALLLDYRDLVDRVMHDYIVGNDAVSEADKTAFGIHLRTTNRVRLEPPLTVPVLEVDNRFINAHCLRFHDSASPHKRGRAASAAYCEVWYKVGGTAPTGTDDTMFRLTITRSGQMLRFSPDDKGKYIHYFARWVNRKGEQGPWSEIATAVVI